MNTFLVFILLTILAVLTLFVDCHHHDCVIQQNDVNTQMRHVCYGIDENIISSRDVSEELAHFSDEMTLNSRIRRLRRRTRYLKRHMHILRNEYVAVRQLDSVLNNTTLSQQTCTALSDVGSRQSLSIHRKLQLLRYLEQEYARLTEVVGILSLMYEDEDQNEYDTYFTSRIATARSTVDTALCELFFTIRKVYDSLSGAGFTLIDSHVTPDGWYTPVVSSWCSASTGSCRRERNGIVLVQLAQFTSLLRDNIRSMR